jgi:hypothetical protein
MIISMEGFNYQGEIKKEELPPAALENILNQEKVDAWLNKIVEIENKISDIYKLHGAPAAGTSSFVDISLNRLSVCKSDIGYLNGIMDGSKEDEGDSEHVMASIETSLGHLEKYLDLIMRFPDYRQQEMSNQGGMFPDISEDADKQTLQGISLNRINYYINESAARLEQKAVIN